MESDAATPAERIARALATLRGPRPFGPPGPRGHDSHHGHDGHRGRFGGPGPLGGAGPFGGPGQHAGTPPSSGTQSGHAHGGPRGFGRGEAGPFGRFAARFRALEALAEASAPLSVSELAERIGVDQPRASRLVQACVEEGHAVREADAADARRTNVVLTDAGRALVTRSRSGRIAAVEQAIDGFTDAEREQLATLLGRLAEAWPR